MAAFAPGHHVEVLPSCFNGRSVERDTNLIHRLRTHMKLKVVSHVGPLRRSIFSVSSSICRRPPRLYHCVLRVPTHLALLGPFDDLLGMWRSGHGHQRGGNSDTTETTQKNHWFFFVC